ncbi:hypothetical protein KTO58_05565 [Chitinophaga pendula]|uniref:hypothetical protein n=1 Tax=Chitinophaga TaxID=79328 RepID=UPI000BAFE265|nr:MULTISPECIES: hypothetical protein [Chitinophaga]ASZ13726.1 hypothetical protein CK934_23605 [Chitinophaga sp. MD30]UCJ08655.1 hypothetical protein KTO58_05565 [Chitinophaga pendula]
MEEAISKLKRHSLCLQLSGTREVKLELIFDYFDLKELKLHLDYWKYACLVNEIDLYASAEERSSLMAFCKDIEKLMEGFYILSRHEDKRIEVMTLRYIKKWREKNRCDSLSKAEQQKPGHVLKWFAEKYRYEYALAEIMDMLDAVINLRQYDSYYRHSTVFFFMAINAFVSMVYE